jgi:hypothetical protein
MSVASAGRPKRERERRKTARRRSRATPHKPFFEHSARSESTPRAVGDYSDRLLTKLRLKPTRKAGACRHLVADNPPVVAVVALGGTQRPGRGRGLRAAATVTRAQPQIRFSRTWRVPSHSAAAGQRRRLRAPPWLLERTGAPAAGTPPGGGHERRSTPRRALRLTAAATERRATAAFRVEIPRASVESPGLHSLGRLFAKRTPRPKAAGPTPGRIVSLIHSIGYRSEPTRKLDSFVKKSPIEEI